MISLNRIVRIRKRLNPYLQNNKKDIVKEFERDFEKIEEKNRVVVLSIYVSYTLLYVSVLSSIFGNFFLFSLVSKIASVFGTTVLLLLVTFLHWYMSLLVSDAQVVASEIISECKKK